MRMVFGAASAGFVIAGLVILPGCRSGSTPEAVERLSRLFIHDTLKQSPVDATAAGYPGFDSVWPDVGAAGIARTLETYRELRSRLNAVKPAELNADDRADVELMSRQVQLTLLELESIRSYRTNPTIYVETVGNGLFNLYTSGPGTEAERFGHIAARLRFLPAYLEQAQKNLTGVPPVWREIALAENEGNLTLVEDTLRKACPESLRAEYEKVAGAALASLRGFSSFLRELPSAGAADWRLQPELYRKKFALVLGESQTPEQVLADAEAELRATRRKMFDLSLPLHKKLYPTHRDPVDLNLIVGEVLGSLARRHVPEAAYFAEAQRTLDESRTLIQAHPFVSLPGPDVLKLIETPVYKRGVYGVGGFNPAPLLRPHEGAFYWLTPIPREWPQDRKESKLREYNEFGLRLLTLHEAIPGHYLQSEWAARVEPEDRRVLRGIYGSGVYVEGWAVYATEQALDAGYLSHSPELRLTFLKQQLRAIGNAILDIRLNLMGMTDEQAMELMTKQTFQEQEEAVAKLQRAKLDSCQLPTYFVGYREFRKLRESTKLEPAEFHRRVLSAGALPMPVLNSWLAGGS